MPKRQDGPWWRVYVRSHTLWVLLLLVGWVAFPVGGATQALRFEFGLIGDLPYNPEQEAKFPHLIQAMNEVNLAFVVHNGDFKSGVSPCSDELFADRQALFQTSKHPFIFLPGDNEWTDCHDVKAGGYDPIE
jgi:hypothetical protein